MLLSYIFHCGESPDNVNTLWDMKHHALTQIYHRYWATHNSYMPMLTYGNISNDRDMYFYVVAIDAIQLKHSGFNESYYDNPQPIEISYDTYQRIQNKQCKIMLDMFHIPSEYVNMYSNNAFLLHTQHGQLTIDDYIFLFPEGTNVEQMMAPPSQYHICDLAEFSNTVAVYRPKTTLNLYHDSSDPNLRTAIDVAYAHVREHAEEFATTPYDVRCIREHMHGNLLVNAHEMFDDFEIKLVNETSNEPMIYLINYEFLRGFEFLEHVYIPQSVIDLCNAGKCKVLVECLWEGHPLDFCIDRIKFKYPQLSPTSIIVSTSGLHVAPPYRYSGGITDISTHGLMFIMGTEAGVYGTAEQRQKLQTHAEATLNDIKSKRHRAYPFLYLARRPDHNRFMMLDKLRQHDLIDIGNIGFGTDLCDPSASNNGKYISDIAFMYMQRITTTLDYELLTKLPLNVEFDDYEVTGQNPYWDFSSRKFSECSVYLVSETSLKRICFSEKTLKAFYAMVPFVIHAGVGSLAELRRIGFKTFDDYFDESYDMEPDRQKRADMVASIIDQVNRMTPDERADMLLSMAPILEHNFYHAIRQVKLQILNVVTRINEHLHKDFYDDNYWNNRREWW